MGRILGMLPAASLGEGGVGRCKPGLGCRAMADLLHEKLGAA